MNAMQVFQNSEFAELGVLEIDGKPYFPTTACAKALGYKRPADAITAHCKGSVKYRVLTKGGEQELKFLPEGDLYRLITHSKLPAAERFEKWVFDEVLPTIHKTGSCGQPDLTAIIMQTATAVCAEMVKQLTPLFQSLIHPTPARRVAWERDWNSNSNPGPRKNVVTRPPTAKGTLRIETFPPDIVCAVDNMMEQMMEEQALNFNEIARYCTGQGYMISSPSVRRYYDKHFNRH